MHNVHACYLQEKWPTVCMYGRPWEGSFDLDNGAVLEKRPQFFCPLSTWQQFHNEQKPQR